MSSWLQHLRSKSPETRHRIALGTSVSVTCLIFVMWITVLNFGGGSEVESLQAQGTGVAQTASPLSAFGDNASSAFKQLKKGISGSGNEEVSGISTGGEAEDPDNFWGETNQERSASQSEQTVEQEDGSDSEPFTSRNYNPNQESEWFVE